MRERVRDKGRLEHIIAYEKIHFPIEKPTVAELIELSLEEKGMTQKQFRYSVIQMH